MKLQLDTTKKTIKIEENINLGELVKVLESLLPNNLWKEFELEVNVPIIWTTPIVIKDYPYYRNPYNPFPWVTYNTDTMDVNLTNLNKGTYSIEI